MSAFIISQMPIAELIVIKGENYKRWDIPLPISSLKKKLQNHHLAGGNTKRLAVDCDTH